MRTCKSTSALGIRCKCIVFVVTISALAENASAGIVAIAREVNGDVVFQGEGTIDTTALIADQVLHSDGAGINPLFGLRFQAEGTQFFTSFRGNITPLPDFGNPTSPVFAFAHSSSGDVIGIFQASTATPFDNLLLPSNYASGMPLSGTMTFTDATFQSLGLSEGTYVASWTTSSGVDTFLLRIVPEPSAFAIATLSLVSLAAIRRLVAMSS
jgi:hypothetical protein